MEQITTSGPLIQSVVKAVEVLEALASNGAMAARDLERLTGIPRSTAQRLLQTLHRCDMVQQDAVMQRYSLGPRVMQLGAACLSRVDVRTRGLPYMKELWQQSGETVGLSVRVADSRIYIEQLESRQTVRTKAEVGELYPLYSGAPGRVLLAFMNDDEAERILNEADFRRLTEHTPPSKEKVRQLVHDVRVRGYAMAFEETIAGLNTIAAPIFDHAHQIAAAMSISGPAPRFDEDAMRGVLDSLLSATAAVSRELGLFSAQDRIATYSP